MKPKEPLRKENEEFDSEGLESRMSKFFSDPPDDSPNAPVDPIGAPVSPPEKEEEIIIDEIEDEEFHEIGKKKEEVKPTDSDFDESKFDKETEDEVKGMDAKAGEKWKQLKAQVKQAKLEALEAKKASQTAKPAPEIEQELETLRAKAAEAEALRQRNEELLRVNDRVAVEESTEYRSKVTEPFIEMEKILVSLAENAKIDEKALFDIVTEHDVIKQDLMLEKLEKAGHSRLANRISRIADDYKAVNQVKAQMLENATKTLEASRIAQREAEVRTKEQTKTAFKVSSEKSFEAYAAKIPSFVDSNGQLTDLAKSAMAKASAIDPTTLDSSDLGYMAFCATSFPEARKEIVKLQAEIKMLKAGKTGPTISSGKAGHKAEPIEDSKGLIEAMAGKEFTFAAP